MRPSWAIADRGTLRFPFGSRMTNIVITLDAVAPVEIQHDPERRTCVATQHVHEGRPLPGRDGGERVREKFLASQATWLAVEIAGEMWLALIVEVAKLRRVRLP